MPTITESQWLSLTPEDQWEYVKTEVGAEWSREYHTCAYRHKTFVDWYLDGKLPTQTD